MLIYTADKSGVARINPLVSFVVSSNCAPQLNMANIGSNKTKEKIVPSNSWLINSVSTKSIIATQALVEKHTINSSIVQMLLPRPALYHHVFTLYYYIESLNLPSVCAD